MDRIGKKSQIIIIRIGDIFPGISDLYADKDCFSISPAAKVFPVPENI